MNRSVFCHFCSIFLFFNALQPAFALPEADRVLVVKSERTLYLKRNGESLRAYRVALGPVPWGHKRQAGDERTPEGHYILDFKNSNSRYYKSIRISYPSPRDRFEAQTLGVNPGGNIMIHGQPPDAQWPPEVAQLFNWTDGCIAVSNEDMDEIWRAVSVGTPIEIRP